MELLQQFDVPSGGRIELALGDLATLDPDEDIDILVISAFPDNYDPTPSSLVGALHRRGLSVGELAKEKYADLRPTTSCWISQPVPDGHATFGFRQILCYEPTEPSRAAETVGDVFRALVPLIGGGSDPQRVAMSVLASGNMGRAVDEMVPAILDAAVHWIEHGLPLDRLLIVVNAPAAAKADAAMSTWAEDRHAAAPPAEGPERPYDLFISYARDDGSTGADRVTETITTARPEARVFLDAQAIMPGASWQQEIWDCLNSCRRVVALLTPGFLESKVCQEEFNVAMIRNRDSAEPLLIPLYVHSADLPPHLQALNYIDCREANEQKIRDTCARIAAAL